MLPIESTTGIDGGEILPPRFNFWVATPNGIAITGGGFLTPAQDQYSTKAARESSDTAAIPSNVASSRRYAGNRATVLRAVSSGSLSARASWNSATFGPLTRLNSAGQARATVAENTS